MPISLSLSHEELDKLKREILRSNLKRVETKSQYEALRINDGDIQLILYKSGKLVHNDSTESREFVGRVLSTEVGVDYVIGTDEVGKGEWYGPLVVGCVALTPEQNLRMRQLGIRDSKAIERGQLMRIAKQLARQSLTKHILVLMPEKYNELYSQFRAEGKSLNDLLAWSHASAIRSVLAELGERRIKIVIDKFDVDKTDLRLLTTAQVSQRTPNIEVIQSASGDTEIPVSVASVLAKNEFELRVAELEAKYKVTLRGGKPEAVSKETLPKVAKIHFKNIAAVLARV